MLIFCRFSFFLKFSILAIFILLATANSVKSENEQTIQTTEQTVIATPNEVKPDPPTPEQPPPVEPPPSDSIAAEPAAAPVENSNQDPAQSDSPPVPESVETPVPTSNPDDSSRDVVQPVISDVNPVPANFQENLADSKASENSPVRPPLERTRPDLESILRQREMNLAQLRQQQLDKLTAEQRQREFSNGEIARNSPNENSNQRPENGLAQSYEQRMRELDERLSEAKIKENAERAGPGHESHMNRGRISSHFHGNQLHVVRDDPHRIIPHGSHSHTVEETEQNSGFIFATMIAVIAASQIGILLWKKYHTKSFDWASLFGLWIIPCIWSIYGSFWRMLLIWSIYSLITGYVMKAALKTPVERGTPRLVYSFFFFVYKACYALAISGYFMIMSDFLGISFLLLPSSMVPLSGQGFVFMFYGLYYGVLSRDLCQICSQRMAVNIGYIAAKGAIPNRELPVNMCAICDRQLFQSIRLTDTKNEVEETVHSLNCGHKFHDFCLRGWTIIGKRESCPACNEKVQLRSVFTHPWEATTLAWGVVLDGLRYMIVFNPIIFIAAQTILYWVW